MVAVLEAFLSDTPVRIAEMRRAARENENDKVKIDAHAIKSSAASIGFMRLSRMAKALEQECAGLSGSALSARVDEFERCFAEADLLGHAQIGGLTRESKEIAGNHIGAESPDGTFKLLVIDDDLVQRMIIARIGVQAGFDVIQASTFEEAATRLKSESFDCVTIDLSLGDRSGALLLPLIADVDCRLPIILISGVDEHILEATAKMSRLLDLETQKFAKPVNLVRLREALMELRHDAPALRGLLRSA
eukprot:gene40530-54803_t